MVAIDPTASADNPTTKADLTLYKASTDAAKGKTMDTVTCASTLIIGGAGKLAGSSNTGDCPAGAYLDTQCKAW